MQPMTETTLKTYCAVNKISRSGMDYHIRRSGVFPIGSKRFSEAGAPSFLWRVTDLDEIKALIKGKKK
jgi:hypothetical protein